MTLLLDRPTQQALLELKRVLIVDDEEPIRRLLAYMLQSHGYEVVVAAEAKEARVRLDESPFALVLCDVNMPGESGMDLVRHTFRQHPHTAAIMVTGLDSPLLANAALDMGAFGYIINGTAAAGGGRAVQRAAASRSACRTAAARTQPVRRLRAARGCSTGTGSPPPI